MWYFNVDFLSESHQKDRLLDMFNSFGLRMAISEPTLETRTTSSCIDNIFTNVGSDMSKVDILDLRLSDHYFLELWRNQRGASYSFEDKARYGALSNIFGRGFVPIGCP